MCTFYLFIYFFFEFFAFIDFNLQIASGTAEWCFVSHSKGITTSSPFPYFHSTAVHHVYVAAVQPAVHHHLEAAYLPHLYTASNSWELDARWCNKWTKRYEVILMYIYTHKGLNLYLNWIIIILIACLLDIWSIELIWLAFLFDGLIFFLVYPYLCLLLFVLSACVDLDFICNAFFVALWAALDAWWWCSVVQWLGGLVIRWLGGSVAWWLCGDWPTWLGNPRQCPTTDWRPATVANRNDSLDPLDSPAKPAPDHNLSDARASLLIMLFIYLAMLVNV